MKITDHTNNQNGTTHRDLQSNNKLQTRLQTEIHKEFPGNYYRIKRGEHLEWPDDKVIENELAARILLAFDRKDPSSCHQTYKLFDEKHSEIFGRPEVTGYRIVALHDLYRMVFASASNMKNELFGKYGLTRYLILYLIREALESDKLGKEFCESPQPFIKTTQLRDRFNACASKVCNSIVTFLDNEVTRRNEEARANGADHFDYKRELKSPTAVNLIRSIIVSHYQIVTKNKYAPTFSEDWTKLSQPSDVP